MANLYPGALNLYATGTSSATLVAAGHASAHNAYEAKLGIGASTPVANTVLRGTGTGSSSWAQVVLTTDVSGILPVANGGTGVSSSTGSGSVVLSTSPTLVTPVLGVATATSINGLTITTTTGTLTIASAKTLTANNSLTFAGVDGKTLTINNSLTLAGTDGKTLTVSNSLTLAGTDATTMTFPSTSDTVVTLAATQTITNKRRTRRLVTTTQSATPTINTDNGDIFKITGLAQAITSFTTNLSGTPVDGDLMEIRITDNGTARALTFGASFEATTVALPTTTVISTELKILFEWNSVASKWDCVATA